MTTDTNQTANRLFLLAKDAKRVTEYLDALVDLKDSTIDLDPRGTLHSALLHAAVIVYVRSFKRNQKTNHEVDAKADLTQLNVAQYADLMACHELIIDQRDTIIAHSDWDKRRSIVLEKFPVENSLCVSTLRATTSAEGWEKINVGQFMKLASLVHEQALARAFELDRS